MRISSIDSDDEEANLPFHLKKFIEISSSHCKENYLEEINRNITGIRNRTETQTEKAAERNDNCFQKGNNKYKLVKDKNSYNSTLSTEISDSKTSHLENLIEEEERSKILLYIENLLGKDSLLLSKRRKGSLAEKLHLQTQRKSSQNRKSLSDKGYISEAKENKTPFKENIAPLTTTESNENLRKNLLILHSSTEENIDDLFDTCRNENKDDILTKNINTPDELANNSQNTPSDSKIREYLLSSDLCTRNKKSEYSLSLKTASRSNCKSNNCGNNKSNAVTNDIFNENCINVGADNSTEGKQYSDECITGKLSENNSIERDLFCTNNRHTAINCNSGSILKFYTNENILRGRNSEDLNNCESGKKEFTELKLKEGKKSSKNLLLLKSLKRKPNKEGTNSIDKKRLKYSEIQGGKDLKDKMSVYEQRVLSDEKSIIGNGYMARNGPDDNSSNSMSNHFYQCSQQQQQPTIATLCNIGNTCYLNSVVYTLRFAPMFLHNLHHLVDDLSNINQILGRNKAKSSSLGRNVSGISMESGRSWSSKDLASLENSTLDVPKSNQQIATEKLHELYQHLHRNEVSDITEPFHADTFLHSIQDVSPIFEGNQQQDAHEFLMCVLNSIRETCQSLIKAVSDYPDIITNGFSSLPEQVEIIEGQCQLPRENSSSAIIKTSFFSRKSKRKEEGKILKNIRLQSPHRDNYTPASSSVSATTMVSGTSTTAPTNSRDGNNSLDKGDLKDGKATPVTENEVTVKDKERISEKIKKLGLDFFTEDFEVITVSTTKCLSCETVTEQKETMIDIAVPISQYDSTETNTSDKASSFIQKSCVTKEYFSGENKYRCEQCVGYTEAIRSISYEVLPRLLVIQLSRFSGGMEKINSYLPTPFTLQCFCVKCSNNSEGKKLHLYKLYSVITHVGATMSVGHYIAYTCSLDWANDYMNCPKDRRKHQPPHLNHPRGSVGSVITSTSGSNTNIFGGNSNNNGGSTNNSNSSNGSLEKNVALVKKMIFGRSKASSSGDMSKTVKNLNGISAKTLANGLDKMSINTTCQSINCCSIRIKGLNNSSCYSSSSSMSSNSTSHLYNSSCAANGVVNSNNNSNNNNNNNAGILLDDNDKVSGTSLGESNNTSSYSHATTNNGGGPNRSGGRYTANGESNSREHLWYMCDDDKIKVMSQREFEELLSPKRKIMITPYLLFYVRTELQ